jgi:hypothetical protein
MGVVATTASSRMGTAGHGTVPATWTLMGMPSGGTHHWGACVCAWGWGKRHLPVSEGHRVGGARRLIFFGFWLMSKNVKDPTDRHWNMNFFFFFFFFGKLTDRMERKTTRMPSPHPLLPEMSTFP